MSWGDPTTDKAAQAMADALGARTPALDADQRRHVDAQAADEDGHAPPRYVCEACGGPSDEPRWCGCDEEGDAPTTAREGEGMSETGAGLLEAAEALHAATMEDRDLDAWYVVPPAEYKALRAAVEAERERRSGGRWPWSLVDPYERKRARVAELEAEVAAQAEALTALTEACAERVRERDEARAAAVEMARDVMAMALNQMIGGDAVARARAILARWGEGGDDDTD